PSCLLYSVPIPRPPRSTPFPYTTLFRSHPKEESPSGQYICPMFCEGEDKIYHEPGRCPVCGMFLRPIEKVQKPDPHAKHQHGHRSEEHTSELQSRENLVCRLLLEKKKNK